MTDGEPTRMRCRSLGWAGLQIDYDGATIVVDPLADPAATFAAVGPAAAGIQLPEVVASDSPGQAVAGLVTHLHRDHTDAEALRSALADDAPVLGALGSVTGLPGAGPLADLSIKQARADLESSGLSLRELAPWQTAQLGPFTVTALPAADGAGDPQVSWAIAAGSTRVVHCGDTMFHGWWWRIAEAVGPFDAAFLPINGAVLGFPWRRPSSPFPAAMTPEQAAVAAAALGASALVPMHYGGFDIEPFYRSIPDALQRVTSAVADAPCELVPLRAGETLEL